MLSIVLEFCGEWLSTDDFEGFLAGYLLSFMNGDEKQPDSRREPILKIQDRSKIDPDVLTILAMAQTSCV